MNYSQNGDKFIYAIKVKNLSSYTDTNIVTIIEPLPSGISYSSHTNTQGTFNPSTLTWTIPSLPGKTETFLYLKVLVTNAAPSSFAITYTATGTLTDSDLDDNTATLTANKISCSPSGGGVPDFTGTSINVALNDTVCTLGVTEWRYNPATIINGVLVDWNYLTGVGIFKYIDPTEPITGTYDLWCVQGVDEYQISCNVAWEIAPSLVDKNVFDHTSDTYEYADISNEDRVAIQILKPSVTIANYCWRLLRNSNGDITSAEAIDCNVTQDNRILKFCSNVDCTDIPNDCPSCDQNQLPSDVQILVADIENYTPEVGDVIIVQHPNASSDYSYTALGWIRNICGCVWKISQDDDNLLTLGSDKAPYLNSDIYFASLNLVENNLHTNSFPNIITADENGKVFTNTTNTSSGLNYHTLPAAATGLYFSFIVTGSQGMIIKATGNDYIRIVDQLSGEAGYFGSFVVGSYVTLVAVNSTLWVASSSGGTWLVDLVIPTPTPTVTPTTTVTPTVTPTITVTPSISVSVTPTPTVTVTPTVTPSA